MPAETKIAFLQYMKTEDERDKEKRRRLRRHILYGMFDTEAAFRYVQGREGQVEGWYACIREILEPKITLLRECDQRRIIASLTMEKARMEAQAEDGGKWKQILEQLLKHR